MAVVYEAALAEGVRSLVGHLQHSQRRRRARRAAAVGTTGGRRSASTSSCNAVEPHASHASPTLARRSTARAAALAAADSPFWMRQMSGRIGGPTRWLRRHRGRGRGRPVAARADAATRVAHTTRHGRTHVQRPVVTGRCTAPSAYRRCVAARRAALRGSREQLLVQRGGQRADRRVAGLQGLGRLRDRQRCR